VDEQNNEQTSFGTPEENPVTEEAPAPTEQTQPTEPSTPPATPTEPTPDQTTQPAEYATFLQRFLAAFIDAIIIGFVTGALGALLGIGTWNPDTGLTFNPLSLIGVVYAVFMLVKYGATIGKMALGLRVENENTGENLNVVEAILRELVGKFVSAAVLFLGYFWMLWDPKKQTWHDKIAKSVVKKVR
jgi:uncharacterized RDD family membrane protein YckC